MKNLKTFAAALALAASAFAIASAHAGMPAPSLKLGGMTDLNGPSLDGFVDSDSRRSGSSRFHDRHSRRSCRYDLQRHNA